MSHPVIPEINIVIVIRQKWTIMCIFLKKTKINILKLSIPQAVHLSDTRYT